MVDSPPATPRKRLYVAMACYAALALLAAFTLVHPFRTAVLVLLLGLAVKTAIAAVPK